MKSEKVGGHGMVHRAQRPSPNHGSMEQEERKCCRRGNGVQKCFWKGGDFAEFRLISLNLDKQINQSSPGAEPPVPALNCNWH